MIGILMIIMVNLCTAQSFYDNSPMLLQRPTRIVGGKNAEKGRHSWQLSIHWGNRSRNLPFRHICGGSLITAGWILTAGHCVTLAPNKPPHGEFIILAGKHRLGIEEDTEQRRIVTETFVHPFYNGTVAPFDIALMKVDQPFELNEFISTVTLPSNEEIPEGEVMLTGWGSISRTKMPKHPVELQVAELTILDNSLCKQALKKALRKKRFVPLHPTNICTGPLDGSLSACKGDSGGPLIYKNYLDQAEVVGIVSWGLFPCGGGNAPSVYTRVSAFIPWIEFTLINN